MHVGIQQGGRIVTLRTSYTFLTFQVGMRIIIVAGEVLLKQCL